MTTKLKNSRPEPTEKTPWAFAIRGNDRWKAAVTAAAGKLGHDDPVQWIIGLIEKEAAKAKVELPQRCMPRGRPRKS